LKFFANLRNNFIKISISFRIVNCLIIVNHLFVSEAALTDSFIQITNKIFFVLLFLHYTRHVHLNSD